MGVRFLVPNCDRMKPYADAYVSFEAYRVLGLQQIHGLGYRMPVAIHLPLKPQVDGNTDAGGQFLVLHDMTF